MTGEKKNVAFRTLELVKIFVARDVNSFSTITIVSNAFFGIEITGTTGILFSRTAVARVPFYRYECLRKNVKKLSSIARAAAGGT